MKILGIETSCDDTAISIIKAKGNLKNPTFRLLSQVISSQTELHSKWGGVVPNLAKREHSKNLVPVLHKAINKSKVKTVKLKTALDNKTKKKLEKILEREPDLYPCFIKFIEKNDIPSVDLIVVTKGPGLELALWTGINFARALSFAWNIPLLPVNHMDGHIVSPLLNQKLDLPALALLVSGGHTELALVRDFDKYKVLGETRDDAAGEAFDKVARILGLPYPGGPEISRLAKKFKQKENKFSFPRPMITSKDFDFSFSGLKTSVLYTVQKIKKLTEKDRIAIAHEFEIAVIETLTSKTLRAVEKHKVKTLIVAGGVSANQKLKATITKEIKKLNPKIKVLFPEKGLSTDNGTMIAMAGYIQFLAGKKPKTSVQAVGNLPLGKI